MTQMRDTIGRGNGSVPGRSRHFRPVAVVLMLVLGGAVQACSSTTHPAGAQNGAVDGTVDTLDSGAGDAPARTCPANVGLLGACNVASDVVCYIPQGACLPAGCLGDFSSSCQCRGARWQCASYECFGPCATTPDASGG